MTDDRIDEILIRGLDKVETKCDDIKDEVNSLNSQFRVHEEAFMRHLEQDEKMYEELHRMNNILQTNTESLQEHMHRTEIQEKTNEMQSEAILKIDGRLKVFEEQQMKKEAVKEHLTSQTKKWGVRLGIISTALGIIAKLIGLF